MLALEILLRCVVVQEDSFLPIMIRLAISPRMELLLVLQHRALLYLRL